METKDILILIVMLAVLVGGYGWHRRRLVVLGHNWRELAAKLGGRFESNGEGWIREPNHTLICELSGVELELITRVTETGSSTTYWTYARTKCDPLMEFNIYREDVFGTISKGLGFQDIEVDDPEYDRTFIIKSNDSAELLRNITREFRMAHLDLQQANVGAEKGSLEVVQKGLIGDPDEALKMLELAALAARTFLPS